MIFPEVPAEEWIERWNLRTPEPIRCECGKQFPEGKPVIVKGYAGLHFECPCGSVGSIFVPNKEDTKSLWRKIF